MSTLEEMQQRVRAFNVAKGWRVDGDHSVPDANCRTFGDDIALIHSELSEALEAFREWGTRDMLRFDSWPDMVFPQDDIEWETDRNFVAKAIKDGERWKPEGVPSELADVFVRLLDTCAHLGIDLELEFNKKMDYNDTRSARHGGKKL